MPLIYCVEDDESIRELVSYALRGQGYKVEGFGDANALYDALQKNIPVMLLHASGRGWADHSEENESAGERSHADGPDHHDDSENK